jgi:hypothetical protein
MGVGSRDEQVECALPGLVAGEHVVNELWRSERLIRDHEVVAQRFLP